MNWWICRFFRKV